MRKKVLPKKTKAKSFHRYINSLSDGEYIMVVDQIIHKCELPRYNNRCYIWENWKHGKTVIKPVYQNIINGIAGEKLKYSKN